jgi:hypothetical protein
MANGNATNPTTNPDTTFRGQCCACSNPACHASRIAIMAPPAESNNQVLPEDNSRQI